MKRILFLAVLLIIIVSILVFAQTISRKNASNDNSAIVVADGKIKNAFPDKKWTKAKSPENYGWSTEKLKLARDFASTLDTSAVLIVEDGVIVDEWGETSTKYNVHSVRKSLLSGLIGIAVDEGKINLDDTLEKLGIDDNEPKLTSEEKQARVADLLKGRSGVYHNALYETEGMRNSRPSRGSHPPGTFWYYNNWDFNALGTIYEKSVRSTIFEEFQKRIAEPLQMEDFSVKDTEYIRGSDSIHPAYLFRMSARDLARYGLLFLREGEWRGKQIISKKWIAESTKYYSSAGGWGGYGYMWRVEAEGRIWNHVSLPAGTFCAAGRGGHWLVVVPKQKLVIAHRVNTDISGNDVDGNQWGKLLELILTAKSFACC